MSYINTDSGNDCYIISALSDLVAKYEILTDCEAIERLMKFGFNEQYIKKLFSRYNLGNTINIADIDKLLVSAPLNHPSIVLTYPAYDNRGIPDKIGQNSCISSIHEELMKMFSSATKEINILSPYIERDGAIYFESILNRKLQRDVTVNLIVREFEQESSRKEKMISWINSCLMKSSNFSLYNYHYTSDSGSIESTCHAKIVTVDDSIAYVGSADIRKRSFERNFEMGTIHTGYVAKKISYIVKELIGISEKYILRGRDD